MDRCGYLAMLLPVGLGSVNGCLAAKYSLILLPACSSVAQGLPDDKPAIGQQFPDAGVRCQNGNICTKAIHPRTKGGNLPQFWAEMGRDRWPNLAVEIFQLVVKWNIVHQQIPHFYELPHLNSTRQPVGDGVARWGQNQPQHRSGIRGMSERVEGGLTPRWKRAWSVGCPRCGHARTRLMQLAQQGNRHNTWAASGMEPSESDRPADGDKDLELVTAWSRLSTQSLATNQNPWTATTRMHACHTCATSNVRVMQDTAYTKNNGDTMVKPKRVHTEATYHMCTTPQEPTLWIAKESLMKLADLLQRGMPVQLSKTIGVRCEGGGAGKVKRLEVLGLAQTEHVWGLSEHVWE